MLTYEQGQLVYLNVLKDQAEIITEALSIIFDTSSRTDEFPVDWRTEEPRYSQ